MNNIINELANILMEKYTKVFEDQENDIFIDFIKEEIEFENEVNGTAGPAEEGQVRVKLFDRLVKPDVMIRFDMAVKKSLFLVYKKINQDLGE